MPLTKKQKHLLDAIRNFITTEGYAPSVREIAAAAGLSSPATVHEHLTNLRGKGYITFEDGRVRTVEVINVRKEQQPSTLSIMLPLVGLIAAGEPIEAIETQETIAVSTNMIVNAANTYVLKVKGNSMIDDGILDGDYVVIERNPSPKNGDIVVALLDNQYATLKRFYREKGRIRLQPANSALSPIYVKDPLIQGVVRAVIRNFQNIHT